MLRIKEVSLNYHLDHVDRILGDVQLKPSLTERLIEKLVRWVKPAL